MKPVHIAATQSHGYDYVAMRNTVRRLLERLPRPLASMVKRGDRVLVKPHLQHGSVRDPASRLVSHPVFIRCVVEACADLGARVAIGDEGSHTAGAYAARHRLHRLHGLAGDTGAELVNFAVAGARPVRSGLLFPSRHWISNAVLDADLVVNCGNAQPHPRLLFSGAVKNMFNALVGDTQDRLYILFPQARDLARLVASVCLAARPGLSLLDMTTVHVPVAGSAPRAVGLVLAGEDPVALDTVAAHALGHRGRAIWTSLHGQALGLGCGDLARIAVHGCAIGADPSRHIPWPELAEPAAEGAAAKLSRYVNTAWLRDRPAISAAACVACGDCRQMCPTGAVVPRGAGFEIVRGSCIDCGRCAAACEHGAVELRHHPLNRAIRFLLRREAAPVQP